MALGVDAARDRQAHQLQARVNHLTGFRIGMGKHDRANFDRPYAAFQIEFNGQGLTRIFVVRDVREEGAGIYVNRMAAGRLDNLQSLVTDALRQIRNLLQR
jgi:hypothetical protein